MEDEEIGYLWFDASGWLEFLETPMVGSSSHNEPIASYGDGLSINILVVNKWRTP